MGNRGSMSYYQWVGWSFMDYFERYLDDGEDARVRLNAVKKSIFDYYANIKTDNSKIRLHESTIDAQTAFSLTETVLKSQITMGELNTKYEHDLTQII